METTGRGTHTSHQNTCQRTAALFVGKLPCCSSHALQRVPGGWLVCYSTGDAGKKKALLIPSKAVSLHHKLPGGCCLPHLHSPNPAWTRHSDADQPRASQTSERCSRFPGVCLGGTGSRGEPCAPRHPEANLMRLLLQQIHSDHHCKCVATTKDLIFPPASHVYSSGLLLPSASALLGTP